MATLAAVKARIADEINRTDLTTQIGYAVSDAIKLYQARRFRFNQARSSFSTTNGAEFYTTSTIPDDIAEIDSLRLTVNGRYVTLDRWSFRVMEDVASTTSTEAQPRAWAWYAQQIRLYPIPDAAYTLTISYLQKIDEPAEGASNVWTDEAGALIRHAAKRIVLADVLQDGQAAGLCAQAEALEYRRHQTEAQQLETGGLRGSM
jgi:hypothetical protein